MKSPDYLWGCASLSMWAESLILSFWNTILNTILGRCDEGLL